MRKKLLSILLTLAMLLSLVPAGYAADIEIVDEPDIVISADDALMIDGAEIHVNPLYRDQISAEELAASLREAAGTDAVTYSCGSIEEAAAALREGMKARETDVTIRYTGSESFDYRAVLDLAMAHTGNPTEGDYLRFQYGGWSIRYSSTEYRYQLTYYTTAEQEAELDAAVNAKLNELALGGKTEYQKIRAIYDFITANTVYDHEHLGNNSYKLQYTAYAAMINKTSVCQGYANLLYRMLLSVGVDTRIVTSETHAWNIVKIGDWYYNVDSTWDAGNNGNYSWFLKCMDHFTGDDHVREAPYSEDAFLTEYPMSPTDYSEGDNPITLEKEELTLYLGGDPATVRFTIDPTYDYSYVSFSYTGGGLFSITGNSYSVTITPLKAGGGVVNVMLKDEDGGTLAKATIYVTVLESAPESITGQCGENLFWTLDDQGTLTITGAGDMWDYSTASSSYSPAPWFEQRETIKTVVFEDGATSIGNDAFDSCINLTSVSIPEGVTRIGDYSFDYCVSLPDIKIPESVTEIGYCAFENCYSFEKVDIPDHVKELDDYAFCRCRNMDRVTIGSGVTRIGKGAFAECEKLGNIHFGGSAPELDESVFLGVTATAYYPANDPSWTEDVMQDYGGTITWVPYIASGQCGENLFWTLDDQGALTITGTGDMWDSIGAQGYGGAWSAYGAQIRTVIIEDGATSIGVESFKNCDQITSVVIPDSLLVIDNQAFLNCSALESLSLGEGLVGIGYESFSGCSSLQSVRLPDSVTGLSVGVFGYCSSLRSVSIGSGLQSFYASDFYFCNKLTELTVSEDNPTYCSVDNVIFSKDGKELVCCPNGRAGEYRIPDGTAIVKAGAFANCAALTDVTVPDSVTEIGIYVFENCGSLTEIRFEGHAPAFGEHCFENTTATAYYPGFDLSWTEDVRQDYGGTITWVAETGDGLPVDEEHFPDEAFRAYVAENFDWDSNGLLNDEEIAAITEIDVSMMGIASLHGIEFFPELTVLFCLDNELTKLDLSRNPKLEMLDCSFNSLTSLDLTHNPALTSIDCSENAITDLDTSANPLLEGLFCYGNEIFMLRLYGSPALQVLDCSTNRLTALDLSGNPGLVMLECYGNSIAELDLTPCPTLVDVVTNGTYEQKPNYDSYTASTGNFVHVDPTTKLGIETFTITLTDYTKGAAQTSIDFTAKYSGELSFTLSADSAVVVAVKKGDEYTLLRCSTSRYENWFSLNVTEDTELVFAFKGDADLNGKVATTDGTMIKRAAMGTYTFDSPLKTLVSDLNGDGVVRTTEGTMVSRAAMKTYTISWI